MIGEGFEPLLFSIYHISIIPPDLLIGVILMVEETDDGQRI